MSKIALSIAIVAFGFAQVVAGSIREGSLNGFSNGSEIIVRWQSEDEAGLKKVEIERQAGVEGAFIVLNEVALKGSFQLYEYVDDSAFRITDNLYRYRLKVSYVNGTIEYYGPITVRHTVNSVRRTWGSIKAMFR